MTAGVPIGGTAMARVAAIEARLGIGAARGVDRRPDIAAGDFDALVRTHQRSIAGSAPIATTTGHRSDVPFGQLFEDAGRRHGVDPALLAAVADVESGFDPTAVSHAGAQGLMQLMPATARGLGVADSFDPAQAVDGAARLLAGHLQKYGRTDLALAAYNAGGGAVDRFGGIPPYEETRAYVPKVLARLEELRR